MSEKRETQFIADNKAWLWIQLAAKQWDAPIPRMKRWHREGTIEIERRDYAGTRGVRLFVNKEQVEKAKLGKPIPAGWSLLGDAVSRYKADRLHEATVRIWIKSELVQGVRHRWGSNSHYIVNDANLNAWMEHRKTRPDPTAWVEGKELENSYSFTRFDAVRWAAESCPYRDGEKLTSKKFPVLKTNGRECDVWFYKRSELNRIEAQVSKPSDGKCVGAGGHTYIHWQQAAKRANVHPFRLWDWSHGTQCKYLPEGEQLRFDDVPILPTRPTMREDGKPKLTVVGYDVAQIEIIRGKGNAAAVPTQTIHDVHTNEVTAYIRPGTSGGVCGQPLTNPGTTPTGIDWQKVENEIGNSRMSGGALAKRFGLDPSALDGRLGRWRRENGNGWIETQNPGHRDPKFLYTVSAIIPVLRDAVAALDKRGALARNAS